MKKGSSFLMSIKSGSVPTPNVFRKGVTLEIQGTKEIIHSISAVEFTNSYVTIFGFLAHKDEAHE